MAADSMPRLMSVLGRRCLPNVGLRETAGREDRGSDPKVSRQGGAQLIEEAAAVFGGDADLGERVAGSDFVPAPSRSPSPVRHHSTPRPG